MLAKIRRKRDGLSVIPSKDTADQFFGDVIPASLTHIKIFFLYILDIFSDTDRKLCSRQRF